MKQLLLTLLLSLSAVWMAHAQNPAPAVYHFQGKDYYIYPLRIDRYLSDNTVRVGAKQEALLKFKGRVYPHSGSDLKIPSMDLHLPDGEYLMFYAQNYRDKDTAKVYATFIIQQEHLEGPASFYGYQLQMKTDSGYFRGDFREGTFYSFGYKAYSRKLAKKYKRTHNRVLIGETPFANDKLHGKMISYTIEGNLNRTSEYEQDNLVGEVVDYFTSGVVNYRRHYVLNHPDSIPPAGYARISDEYRSQTVESYEASYEATETVAAAESSYDAALANPVLHGTSEDYFYNGQLEKRTLYYYGYARIVDTIWHYNGKIHKLRSQVEFQGLPDIAFVQQFDTLGNLFSEAWVNTNQDRAIQERMYNRKGKLIYEMPYLDLSKMKFDSLYRYSVSSYGDRTTEVWKLRGSRHHFNRVSYKGVHLIDFRINTLDSAADYLNWTLIVQDTLQRLRLENTYSVTYHGITGGTSGNDLGRRFYGETSTYALFLDGKPYTGFVKLEMDSYLPYEMQPGLAPGKIRKKKMKLRLYAEYSQVAEIHEDEPYYVINGNWLNGAREGEFKFYKNTGSPKRHPHRVATFKGGKYHGQVTDINYRSFQNADFLEPLFGLFRVTYVIAGFLGPRYTSKDISYLKEGVYDGPDIRYKKKGFKWKISESKAYKNGYLDGPYLEYQRPGKLSTSAVYTDGYKNGVEESYFFDGSKQYSRNYDMGRPDGKWIAFNYKGNIMSEIRLQQGYLVGESKTYYNTQVLQMTLQTSLADSNEYRTYKELDNYTGVYQYFYNNTVRSAAGNKLNGEPTGTWQYWDENGNLSKVINYKPGKVKVDSLADSLEYIGDLLSWYPNVFKKAEGYIIQQDFEFDCTQDRAIPVEYLYWKNAWKENGEPMVIEGEGHIVTTHSNGKTESEGDVKHGLMHGVWRFYDPNGNLSSIGLYVQGKKQGRWLSGDLGGLSYLNDKCFESPEAFEMSVMFNNEVTYTESWYEKGVLVKEDEITLYR